MSDLPNFTESTVCASGVHCQTCRDPEGGRRFRENLHGFTLPVVPPGAPGFLCPHGKPFGFKREAVGVVENQGVIATNFDPQAEKRRLRAGGCCHSAR